MIHWMPEKIHGMEAMSWDECGIGLSKVNQCLKNEMKNTRPSSLCVFPIYPFDNINNLSRLYPFDQYYNDNFKSRVSAQNTWTKKNMNITQNKKVISEISSRPMCSVIRNLVASYSNFERVQCAFSVYKIADVNKEKTTKLLAFKWTVEDNDTESDDSSGLLKKEK